MCKNCDRKKTKCAKPQFSIIGGSIKQQQNSDVKVEQPNNNVICSNDTKTKQNNKTCKKNKERCNKKKKKCDKKDKRSPKGRKCISPKKDGCKSSKSKCKQDNVANQDGTQAQVCINDSNGTNITQDSNNPQATKK